MPNSLHDEMIADAVEPSEDKLDKVRRLAEKARDLELSIIDIKQSLEDHQHQLLTLQRETLPHLFIDSGIDRLDLAARGNLPACTATLTDFYRANIAADWEPQRREEAFQLLEDKGLGDLIKTVIEIRLGLHQSELYEKIMKALAKLEVMPNLYRSVPWSTLTAAIKEIYQHGEQLDDSELSSLGAFVGQVVHIKPKKEK